MRFLLDRVAVARNPAGPRPDLLDEGEKEAVTLVRVLDVRLSPIGAIFFDGFYREFDVDASGWRQGQTVSMTIYRAAQPLCFQIGRGAVLDEPCRQEVWRVYRSRGEWFACVEGARPSPPTPTADMRLRVAIISALIVVGLIATMAWLNS